MANPDRLEKYLRRLKRLAHLHLCSELGKCSKVCCQIGNRLFLWRNPQPPGHMKDGQSQHGERERPRLMALFQFEGLGQLDRFVQLDRTLAPAKLGNARRRDIEALGNLMIADAALVQAGQQLPRR